MRIDTQFITGDTAGQEFALRILRFDSAKKGPKVYIQAALHAGELPGVAAIHHLVPMLERAEAAGEVLSDITILPQANPIGLSQALFDEPSGRFDLATRINFNRSFPLPGGWSYDEKHDGAVAFLKSTLMQLSSVADIVLDLHCDDVGPVYLYVPEACWPEAAPLAAALNAVAVLTFEGEGGGAFDDAVVKRFLDRAKGAPLKGKVVSTVELRGMAAVGEATAKQDAYGLYCYLQAVGAVGGELLKTPEQGPRLVRPQTFVDMVRTPSPGVLIYRVTPGMMVEQGQPIAEIIATPGDSAGVHTIRAPRAGLVLTCRGRTYARRGDNIAKIVTDSVSSDSKPGPLEP
jgi:uncharacterized protein